MMVAQIKQSNIVEFTPYGLKSETRTCQVRKTTPLAIMIHTSIYDEELPTIQANVWIARSIIKVIERPGKKPPKRWKIELPGWFLEQRIFSQQNVHRMQ